MSYTKTLLQGSFIMMIGLGFAAVFAYLTRIFLAHSLSVEDFGLFYAVLSLILVFIFLRDLGLNQAVAKFLPEHLVNKRYGLVSSTVLSVFLFQLLFSFVLVAILWLLADYLGVNYFQNENAVLLIKTLSFYLPLSTMFINISSFLRGFKKPSLGLVQLTKNLLVFLLVIFLIGTYGVLGAAYAYIFSGVALFILFIIPVFRTFNFFDHPPKDFKKTFVKLFLFGLPLIAVSVSTNIISHFDTLMLTYFTTLEAVGIYNVVLPTAMVLLLISSALGSFFMPIISEMWTKKEYSLISSGTNILYRYTLLGSIPLVLVLFVYSDVFLQVFFGDEYVAGSLAFKILLVAIIAKLFVALNGQFLSGIGKPKQFMHAMILGVVTNIILNLLLIPRYGIEGAAIATGLSYLLVVVYSFIHVGKIVSLYQSLKQLPMVLLASLGFLGTVHLVKELIQFNIYFDIILSAGVGVLVYGLLVLLFKLVSVSEVKQLLKQAR